MRIAFIGGGTMAEAMITGILERGLARPTDLAVGEPLEGRRTFLTQKFGIPAVASNPQAAAGSDLVVLAIKPQDLKAVFQDLKGVLRPGQVAVSIVAGARLETIIQGLGHKQVVRVMPNTPAQVGMGMSVWTATSEVPAERREQVRNLLRSFGEEVYVSDEKYLDMATALSASGPAFVFLCIEALIDAGVHIGLPRDMARQMAVQTVLGSAHMVKQTGRHPADLKGMVASPGGTTVEGLLALEEGGVRASLIKAVRSAYEKAKALGA
ncbi:MAG: pyrroline-5-carboxylate reductase [Dehalococcoidia bacterium]|nr:pyrroline-5-carboxylate reductase [Dehalococcoidia bacterium]MDW8120433.1 pyrroline-5-carboxylate reductase [Chloroflexota bacterium]